MEKALKEKADIELFTSIFEEYRPLLVKRATKMLGTLWAEDAVQDVFLIMWDKKSWTNLNPSRNISAYLWQATVNIAKRHYVDNRTVNGYDIVFGGGNIEREPEIFKNLPDKTKGIILGHFIFGYTIKELSEVTGKHRTTVWRVIKDFAEYATSYYSEHDLEIEVEEGDGEWSYEFSLIKEELY